MILITTHESADFDSAAGMLGARLLHPGAVVAFPGAKESALRRYLAAHREVLPEVRAKDVDLDAVETLVLVDTVSPDRIGRFRELLDPSRGLRVLCYDHHPGAEPPRGAELHIAPAGAVSTLMAARLRERSIALDVEQATFLALGIYEDTGGLLYGSATPEDFRAVAWLLERGADLGRIGRLFARGLSPQQVELYHAILHEARTVRVRGVPVAVAAVGADDFVPEASVVVQQYAQASGTPRLVAVIRMGDRIALIVRSRAADFDAARLASCFDGGGHASAASAMIRNRTLIEARDEVLTALQQAVVPAVRAGALATPMLYKVPAGSSVRDGVKLLNRYRVNALPIWEKGKVVGALTRQLADMALHHGLGGRAVKDLVASEIEVVSPLADLDTLRERLLAGSERFVLVGEDPSRIAGIVTRTALLRHLHDHREVDGPPVDAGAAEGEDLSGMLARRLPEGSLEVLRAVGESGVRAYLVGGSVRDLLLRRDNRDLDVVVEGDACRLGLEIARRFDARVRVHEAFQTAAVSLAGGVRLDLATARTEHYHEPAALPEIAPGGIRQDLFRRDFTINALAIRLSHPGFGRLLDYFEGRRDLVAGKIRVLHGLSFIEDPTRALRAIRFAVRLGFEIARESAHLIHVARGEGVFASLSPQRLRRELEQLLEEKRLVRAVQMLASFEILGILHPGLRPTPTTWARLERAEEALAWHRLLYRPPPARGWLVALGVLGERLDPASREELLARLKPGRAAKRILSEAPDAVHGVVSALARRRRAPPPSRIHEICRDQPTEILLLAMAVTGREEVRRAITLYLSRLQDIRADVRGEDLVRAGIPAGPGVAKGLRAALDAKLDGEAPDREAQLARALEAARSA